VTYGRGLCVEHSSSSSSSSKGSPARNMPASIIEDSTRPGSSWVAGGLCRGALGRAEGVQVGRRVKRS